MHDNNDFNKSIYSALSNLKEEYFVISDKDSEIEVDLKETEISSIKTQDRVIRFLEKENAISLRPYYAKGPLANSGGIIAMYGGKPIGYHIKILQPRFDELYKEYSVFSLSKGDKEKYQFNLVIYHNRGTFLIDEKRKIEFRSLMRPYILEMLYKAKGKDVSSDKIKNELRKKLQNDGEIEKLSKVIDDIRNKIKNNFKIDPKIIIPDGVSKAGYRIGEVKINITKE